MQEKNIKVSLILMGKAKKAFSKDFLPKEPKLELNNREIFFTALPK